MDLDKVDRKGLIREAYRIPGITSGECRSIFLDWALSLPDDVSNGAAVAHLLETYGADSSHPMTAVLHDGLKEPPQAGRKGGRKARICGSHT